MELLHLAGESVPLDEQTTNAKDNRNSQVFESLALLAPSQPAVSDKERKKFEDEKSKLYIQLDEKVSWKTLHWCGRKKYSCSLFSSKKWESEIVLNWLYRQFFDYGVTYSRNHTNSIFFSNLEGILLAETIGNLKKLCKRDEKSFGVIYCF